MLAGELPLEPFYASKTPAAGPESPPPNNWSFSQGMCHARSEPGSRARPRGAHQVGSPRPRAVLTGRRRGAYPGHARPQQGLETTQVSQGIFKRNYSKSFSAQEKFWGQVVTGEFSGQRWERASRALRRLHFQASGAPQQVESSQYFCGHIRHPLFSAFSSPCL